VRLVAEFTSEPFHGEGDPPAHAREAWDVVKAAGIGGQFGPLGTSCAGDADKLLDTLRTALGAAFGAGADRVWVEVRDAAGKAQQDEPANPLLRALGPLLDRVGGELIEPTDLLAGDVPVQWNGRLLAGVRLPATVSSSEPIALSAGDGQVESTAPGGLDGIIDDLERQLGSPLADLSRSGKQQAVRLLEEAGAFSYRKSVEAVAASLGVSRFTVYNYLNRERE
jgi:uncharacterized protein YqgV (UPF0045/DUF77 family)